MGSRSRESSPGRWGGVGRLSRRAGGGGGAGSCKDRSVNQPGAGG